MDHAVSPAWTLSDASSLLPLCKHHRVRGLTTLEESTNTYWSACLRGRPTQGRVQQASRPCPAEVRTVLILSCSLTFSGVHTHLFNFQLGVWKSLAVPHKQPRWTQNVCEDRTALWIHRGIKDTGLDWAQWCYNPSTPQSEGSWVQVHSGLCSKTLSHKGEGGNLISCCDKHTK